VKVAKSYKGGAQVGQTLTLFQTGGDVKVPSGQAHPAGGGPKELPTDKKDGMVDPASFGPAQRGGSQISRFFLDGDPEYKAGERYVLLLEPSISADLLQTVSPEGRLKVEKDGTVKSTDPHGDKAAVREVNGKKLDEVEKQHLSGGRS
jgi:hypothetical protein